MNLKVEFSEKLRNLCDERGYKKLAAKVGMFFSTDSCQQFSQEKESNRGPWAYPYREIVNMKTRWRRGGGEEGGRGWDSTKGQIVFTLTSLGPLQFFQF